MQHATRWLTVRLVAAGWLAGSLGGGLAMMAWQTALPRPLAAAHAHNDYLHPRPLADALANGFLSVEADVHLVAGELYVAHERPAPNPARTLRALYLEPLRLRLAVNRGQVYPGYKKPFMLMVDIKTDFAPTYKVLKAQLNDYADVLTFVNHWTEQRRGALVYLSGNCSMPALLADSTRMVMADGRPADLAKDYSCDFMPVVSEAYGKFFTGKLGSVPNAAQTARFRAFAAEAHRRGVRVRLWASPDDEATWRTLLDNGADLLSADDLPRLRDFLLKEAR